MSEEEKTIKKEETEKKPAKKKTVKKAVVKNPAKKTTTKKTGTKKTSSASTTAKKTIAKKASTKKISTSTKKAITKKKIAKKAEKKEEVEKKPVIEEEKKEPATEDQEGEQKVENDTIHKQEVVKKAIRIEVEDLDDEDMPQKKKKVVLGEDEGESKKVKKIHIETSTVSTKEDEKVSKEDTEEEEQSSKEVLPQGTSEAVLEDETPEAKISKDDFAAKLEKELSKEEEKETSKLDDIKIGEESTDNQEDNKKKEKKYIQAEAESTDEEIEEVVKSKARVNRSINIYRRIAYFFLFLVVVLILSSAYFLLTKVTIVLVPDQERLSNNLIFDVYDSENGKEGRNASIEGVVKEVDIESSNIYNSSGSEVIGKEAIGKVTIFNNYSKNQMLVANTRLLTSDGKLFRTNNTVNVPAGGEVEVEMHADDPAPEMAIEPSKFTIPGLWAGLQDKIYAQSVDDVIYQQKLKKHVVQDDIDSAIRDMKQRLLTKAKTDINEAYSNYDQIIYNIDEDSIETEYEVEPGEEVDNFDMNMTASVIVVAFKGDKSSTLARQKFETSLEDGKEVISFDSENIIYTLNKYDAIDDIATINATFEGKVSLKEDTDVIDKEKIVGLNKGQLEKYLENYTDISGFEIEFYPSFLPDFLKRVPKLPERIEVQIKK
ncbi:hypothetical protein C0583_01025 [Candidatus Parcubacteria bacterium]|nr:MAG: hypothetical protein C0583_01025 [Candidatus Parcubacteria bacterium]